MKKNVTDLEIKIATIEIQLMSIRNSIEDITKALVPDAKIENYFKWADDCEKVAKQLLESPKESESD